MNFKNTFYYGEFEYPKKSGNWYTGKFESIITKELYDRANQVLKFHQTTSCAKRNKEFAFTKLMLCGSCGSGITAEEKFKNLLNGSKSRHVYYVCTRNKNQNCRGMCIKEEELVKQLSELIDKIDLEKLGIKQKLEEEINRYSHFRYAVLGLSEEELEKEKNIDMKKYAKYILEKGSIIEKRNLMGLLKEKLLLKNKEVLLVH